MGAEIYKNGDYLKYNPTWHAEEAPWKAKQIIKLIDNNNLNPANICEVGCGAGGTLFQLYLQLDDKISFYGYEISPQAFQLCQDKQSGRLKFKCEDFLEENHGDIYDLLLIIDVIEHIENCYDFLRRLKNKGRHKIFYIPLEMAIINLVFKDTLMDSRKRYGHIHYFTKETALALLTEAGYLIDEFYLTPGFTVPPPSTIVSNILFLPRKIGYMINPNISNRIFGGGSLWVLAR
jgi:SAM-dependent methyltransferase